MSETAPALRADSRPKRSSRTTAIIAIAAGAALLLGGGTTLAYWSTQQTIPAGTIESGDLNLALDGTPAWTLEGVLDTAPAAVADISAVTIVPGDVVTLEQDVTLTLIGTTLEAALVVAEGTVPDGLEATVTTAGVDAADLTAADNGSTVTVTVAFEFDPATAERENVNTTFDLSNVVLTLTQKSS